MRTEFSWLYRSTHSLIILVAMFLYPGLTPGDSVAILGSLINPFRQGHKLVIGQLLTIQAACQNTVFSNPLAMQLVTWSSKDIFLESALFHCCFGCLFEDMVFDHDVFGMGSHSWR